MEVKPNLLKYWILESEYNQAELALHFKTSQANISNIIKGYNVSEDGKRIRQEIINMVKPKDKAKLAI